MQIGFSVFMQENRDIIDEHKYRTRLHIVKQFTNAKLIQYT